MTDSEWQRHLVNFTQSPQERRDKYALVKLMGGKTPHANRMRDWRLSKIERYFNIDETYNPKTHDYGRLLPRLMPDGSVQLLNFPNNPDPGQKVGTT